MRHSGSAALPVNLAELRSMHALPVCKAGWGGWQMRCTWAQQQRAPPAPAERPRTRAAAAWPGPQSRHYKHLCEPMLQQLAARKQRGLRKSRCCPSGRQQHAAEGAAVVQPRAAQFVQRGWLIAMGQHGLAER